MKLKPESASVRKNLLRLVVDDGLPLLEDFIDLKQPLALLAERIDRQSF